MRNVTRTVAVVLLLAIVSIAQADLLTTGVTIDPITAASIASIPTAFDGNDNGTDITSFNTGGSYVYDSSVETDGASLLHAGYKADPDSGGFISITYTAAQGYTFTNVAVYGALSGRNGTDSWFGTNGQVYEVVYNGTAYAPDSWDTGAWGDAERTIWNRNWDWTGKKMYFAMQDDQVQSVTVRFKTDPSNMPRASISQIDLTVAEVPEPATMSLVGLGGLGIMVRRKK